MSSINLRDYQGEALKSVIKKQAEGLTRQLIILPTGSGKTIIISAIAKHCNQKTLIIAHREELINQTIDKLKLFWPNLDIGICKGKKNELDRQVVIGSIQSCSRPKRIKQLKKQRFSLLIIDEAHHAPAKSYLTLIKALGFMNSYRSKLLIGLTATSERNDKATVEDVFEKIVFFRSISTMIREGILVPVEGRRILTETSLKGVSKHLGDFAVGQLSTRINTVKRNQLIVEKYMTYAKDRKTVAFCANVEHCIDLAAEFNKQSISAAAIWGKMPKDKRAEVIADLKNGKVKVVTSCGVLTEGFDEPSIEAIIMARPTMSKSLYIQMVGRGLRPWPGKLNCLVLDFNDKHHTLDVCVTLRKVIPEARELTDQPTRIYNSKRNLATSSDLNVNLLSDLPFDLVKQVKLAWVALGDDEYSLLDDTGQEILIRPLNDGFVADLIHDEKVSAIVLKPLSLEYCTSVCEDFARTNLKTNYAEAKGSWANLASEQPGTEAQRKILEPHGLWTTDMDKMKASWLIRKIIAHQKKQKRIINHSKLEKNSGSLQKNR